MLLLTPNVPPTQAEYHLSLSPYLLTPLLSGFLFGLSLLCSVDGILLVQFQHLHLLFDGLHDDDLTSTKPSNKSKSQSRCSGIEREEELRLGAEADHNA